MVITIRQQEGDMNLFYDIQHQILKLIIGSLLFVYLLCNPQISAEPYISFKTQQACVSCHVNPSGGGMRTTNGNAYGYLQLPETASDANNFDFARINDFIKFGGDLRYDFETINDDVSGENRNSFNVQSAQIYMEIKAGRDDLSIYLDSQVAPGSAINREVFIIKRFKDGDYLKIGKMIPQLGLRIEDDNAFIRQVTGFNFDNSDNGVEYGLATSFALYNLFITNGTSSVSNDDNKFQIGARAELYFEELRLGGAFVYNDGDQTDRQILALFAGYHWGDFTFLAEADAIKSEINDIGGITNNQSVTELVGLVELNYEMNRGHNIKITSEYHDPDDDFREDHEIRHSLIYEYTPYSNIQLRFGYRSREAPPQQAIQNVNRLFVQTHFYF